jgi:hypothetical protein
MRYMNDTRSLFRFVFLVLLAQVSGCSGSETTTIKHKSEVEIAPGKWLVVERKSEIYASDLTAKNPHVLSPFDAVKQFADYASASGSSPKYLEFEFAFEWNGKRVEWRGKELPIALREHEKICSNAVSFTLDLTIKELGLKQSNQTHFHPR